MPNSPLSFPPNSKRASSRPLVLPNLPLPSLQAITQEIGILAIPNQTRRPKQGDVLA